MNNQSVTPSNKTTVKFVETPSKSSDLNVSVSAKSEKIDDKFVKVSGIKTPGITTPGIKTPGIKTPNVDGSRTPTNYNKSGLLTPGNNQIMSGGSQSREESIKISESGSNVAELIANNDQNLLIVF